MAPRNDKAHLFKKGDSVRVWWPPTSDKAKTDYAGMFWPVTITACEGSGKYRVVYDNGETELVKGEHVHNADAPVDFGREGVDFQVGEFVEVFNNSEDDPAAWLARVSKVLAGDRYNVTYPFHDEPDEIIPFSQLRRARLHDKSKGWVIIKPGQQWEDGEGDRVLGDNSPAHLRSRNQVYSKHAFLEKHRHLQVESPLELETFTPKELAEYIQQGEEPMLETKKSSSSIPTKGGVSKKQSKSPAKPNGGASKRKGKPERAKA